MFCASQAGISLAFGGQFWTKFAIALCEQVVQLAQKIAQATKGDSLGADIGVRHEDQLALAVLTGKMQSDAQDLGNLKQEVNTTMQVALQRTVILHFCIA